MKLLLDTCISPKARDALESTGHDVVWTGDWPDDPGDVQILAFAYREERVLVTLDKDFGELAVVYGSPHAGIVRLVDIDPTRQALVCERTFGRYAADLMAGAILTVTTDRVRVRPTSDTD